MKSIDFIPTTEAQFYTWQGTLLSYISSRAGLWGITEAEWTALTALQTDYQTKYAIAIDPATRTAAAVQAKNEAHDAFVKAIRLLVKSHITYNLVVTNNDRNKMGLPIHKTTRTPAPVAEEAPEADVNTSVIGHVKIGFYEKGSDHKKAKPPGQHCVEIGWVKSDVPITRWEDLIHSNVDTNSPFTLSFENDQRGKTIYFALRWENTRGEKGPWSEIRSAVIP
jgi:hypothetical protein